MAISLVAMRLARKLGETTKKNVKYAKKKEQTSTAS
jgi:hypothetical protein